MDNKTEKDIAEKDVTENIDSDATVDCSRNKGELDDANKDVSLDDLYTQIEELQKRLEMAEQADKKAQDQYIRAHAEMENIRRRSERDVSNARKFALENFSKDLLPVIDSMEKALEVKSDDSAVNAMKEGVSMTVKMFIDAISKYGLKQIATIGEKFNPNVHEAMAMQPSKEVEENTVLEVFQNGYELNGRVVRPARVIVSKG